MVAFFDRIILQRVTHTGNPPFQPLTHTVEGKEAIRVKGLENWWRTPPSATPYLLSR